MKVKETQKNLVGWACQKPHPKRKCPATRRRHSLWRRSTNGYISSQCCGSKRKREINCQGNCEYLAIAKSQWIQKLQLSPQQLDFWRAHFYLIHNIEFATLQVKRTHFSNLKDIELNGALEDLIKTYETEERGIIYEYKSSNGRIQTLIDSIQNTINQHQFPKQNTGLPLTLACLPQNQTDNLRLRKVGLDEGLASLKFVLNLINQCINKNISNSTFFDFISYFISNTFIAEDSRL